VVNVAPFVITNILLLAIPLLATPQSANLKSSKTLLLPFRLLTTLLEKDAVWKVNRLKVFLTKTG